MIGTPKPICRHPLENTVTIVAKKIGKKYEKEKKKLSGIRFPLSSVLSKLYLQFSKFCFVSGIV